MIVDSPLLVRLPLGTDRIIPEQGDAQVHIPSSIQPVVVPVQESTIQGNGITAGTSVIVGFANQKTNVAGAAAVLAFLNKGLWEIDLSVGVHTDFAYPEANLGIPDLAILITDSSNGQILMGFYAAVGFSDFKQIKTRFLVNTTMQLQAQWNTIAVGAHLDFFLTGVLNRIL